jgi:hypothetical protein
VILVPDTFAAVSRVVTSRFVPEPLRKLRFVEDTVAPKRVPFKKAVPVAETLNCVVEFCWKVRKLPLKEEEALIPM